MTQPKLFENLSTLLTVDQLAQWLGISPKTIYGWTYRGLIPFERIGPKMVRFRREEIDRWLASNRKE